MLKKAGVAHKYEPTAMLDSLLHTVEDVKDNRKHRAARALPQNPTTYKPRIRLEGELSASNAFMTAGPYTARCQATTKKTISLQDGYVRLFGG